MSLCLILNDGKILTYTSYRRRVGNFIDGKLRRGPNESRDKDSPSINDLPRGRMIGWGQVNFLYQDEKLSLKADGPLVGQLHDDMERKLEYYQIIIFPERT
jgi:hypothetical protein